MRNFIECLYTYAVHQPTEATCSGREDIVLPGAGPVYLLGGDRQPASTASCIYHVTAAPGQRINVSLIDFSVGWGMASNMTSVGVVRHHVTCHRYAMISESATGPSVEVCASWKRQVNVYISQSNTLTILMLEQHHSAFLFSISRK